MTVIFISSCMVLLDSLLHLPIPALHCKHSTAPSFRNTKSAFCFSLAFSFHSRWHVIRVLISY